MPYQELSEKDEKTYFHSWIADNSQGSLNISLPNYPSVAKPNLRFFDRDLGDPTRTNMEMHSQFGGDKTFIIKSIQLSAAFSNAENVTEFIRSAMLTLYIGDKPYLKMPGKLCMGNLLVTGTYNLDKPFVIPPRQLLYANLSVSDRLVANMIKIQEGYLAEHGQIKVELHGVEFKPKHVAIEPLPISDEEANEKAKEIIERFGAKDAKALLFPRKTWDDEEIEREPAHWTSTSYLEKKEK